MHGPTDKVICRGNFMPYNINKDVEYMYIKEGGDWLFQYISEFLLIH